MNPVTMLARSSETQPGPRGTAGPAPVLLRARGYGQIAPMGPAAQDIQGAGRQFDSPPPHLNLSSLEY